MRAAGAVKGVMRIYISSDLMGFVVGGMLEPYVLWQIAAHKDEIFLARMRLFHCLSTTGNCQVGAQREARFSWRGQLDNPFPDIQYLLRAGTTGVYI